MERRDLYQNDLTEENLPSPVQRDEAQDGEQRDPDVDSTQDDADMSDDTFGLNERS